MNPNTRIDGSHPGADLEVGTVVDTEHVFLSIGDGAARRSTAVPLDAFVDALAEHFPVKVVPADAIVIERGESIWTDTEHATAYVKSALGLVSSHLDPDFLDRARAQGVHLIAAAAYLAAHPPVDEAQVEALADELADLAAGKTATHEVARRLVELGWTKP